MGNTSSASKKDFRRRGSAFIMEETEAPEFNANEIRSLWLKQNSVKFSKSMKRLSKKQTIPSMPFHDLEAFLHIVYPQADQAFVQFLLNSFDEEGRSEISLTDFSFAMCLFDPSSETLKLKYIFQLLDDKLMNKVAVSLLLRTLGEFVVFALSMGQRVDGITDAESEIAEELNEIAIDEQVTLEQWIGVMINKQPVLDTLALLVDRFNTYHVVEGRHVFVRKQFNSPTWCHLCRNLLYSLGKQGLSCEACHFNVHESCVLELDQVDHLFCRPTAVSSFVPDAAVVHHWVEENTAKKCLVCDKTIKAKQHFHGFTCANCKYSVHDTCKDLMNIECNLGEFYQCILPPTHVMIKYSETGVLEPEKITFRQISDTSPFCVFVNSKSGANQGMRVIRKFRYLLNPRQVFDLAVGTPLDTLKCFASIGSFRVICCGGDGTIGWVLTCISKISSSLPSLPPVGIIPLGTGNDLSRCLGWGAGYEGEDIAQLIREFNVAETVSLDRWSINFILQDPQMESDPIPLQAMTNYYSVGVDASIALKFHNDRENKPAKFRNRSKNKPPYAQYGAAEAFSSSCADLNKFIELKCDGVVVPLPTLEGLAVLNIPSMYGGSDLWGKKEQDSFAPQSIGDKLIEVVGIFGSMHVAKIKGHMAQSAKRICQGAKIEITTTKMFPMQIDGEPWMQSPCSVTISHCGQVAMLRKLTKLSQKSGKVSSSSVASAKDLASSAST